MEILAVDLGNWNTKTSNNIIFESRYTDEKLQNKFGENVIEYNNVEYFMEKGSWDKEYNKATKNYMPNLLYAIAQSFPNSNEIEINLVLGLPVMQLAQKDVLKEQLENKEFKFKLNGKDKIVRINKLGVVAEGFSALYTLSDQNREDILLIDIGGRTVNIIEFYENKVHTKDTLPYGIFDFYQKVLDRQASLGKNFTIEEMRRLVKNNWLESEDVTVYKNEFVRKLQNDIKQNFKTDVFHVYFCGGGAEVIEKELREAFKDSNILTNAVFANVNGNYNIAKNLWESEK